MQNLYVKYQRSIFSQNGSELPELRKNNLNVLKLKALLDLTFYGLKQLNVHCLLPKAF